MVIFLEESIVDHLNVLIPILNLIFIEDDEQKHCKEKAASILKLCGRFSPAASFEPICLSIINQKTTENEDLAICGFSTFKYLIEGYLEALPAREGLLNKISLVQSLFSGLGTQEFLDNITKPMLNSFAELFGLVFQKMNSTALPTEIEDIFKNHKSQIIRLALTAISIPVYLMVIDYTPELNFRLLKSCIDNTAKLKTDPDAKPFLDVLSKLKEKDSNCLLGEIYAINPSTVARGSNDLLVTIALMNYFILSQEAYPFFDAALVYESAAKEKVTLSKLVLNLSCYFSFYVNSLHQIKEQIAEDLRHQFNEQWSRVAMVCLCPVLKDVYLDVYGYRDDPLEDLELPREKIPWQPAVFSAVDLISNNLKRLEADSVQDFPNSCVAEFLVYVVGFMSNDEKNQTTKWLKVILNILEQPRPVVRYWMQKLEFKVEDSKDHRRLFKNCEKSENIFLKVLTGVFNTIRSLDLSEVEITHVRTSTSHLRKACRWCSRCSRPNMRLWQRATSKTRCSSTWQVSS